MQILIVYVAIKLMVTLTTFTVGSTAFNHGGYIPPRYSCEGDDVNPPLHLQNMPAQTKSLVLIVDDPDAPKGPFDHWIVWDIKPTQMILENSTPGTVGRNGFGNNRYNGPCPSSGTHKYFFNVYALDALLELEPGSNKEDVEKAMQGHIIATATLVGLFRRTTNH